MSHASPVYLGLDVGGTKCAVVVGTGSGSVVARRQWPSRSERGPDAMIDDLVSHSRDLMAQHAAVRSVGVAIGGPLDSETGVIHGPPNLPGWEHVPLKQTLAERLKVPVFVEHDAAACALAEHRWGAGQGVRVLVYLTCGTGFGAGFILDGRIYRGAGGRPSDIGHIRYRPDGPDAYGKPGCVESYAAASALGRLAAWKFPRFAARPPTSEQVAALAREGDADALEVLSISAEAVGDVCAMLADLMYPQLILLGSLAHYLGGPWLDQVRAQFRRESHIEAQRFCRIEPAGLGAKLQDCSALVAAMQVEEATKGRSDGATKGGG